MRTGHSKSGIGFTQVMLIIFGLLGLAGLAIVRYAWTPSYRPVGYIGFAILTAFGLTYFLFVSRDHRDPGPSDYDAPPFLPADEAPPPLSGAQPDASHDRSLDSPTGKVSWGQRYQAQPGDWTGQGERGDDEDGEKPASFPS